MKAISVLLMVGWLAPALAQEGRLMGGSASNDKASFSWETRLEPPSPPLADHLAGGVQTGSPASSRYMWDKSQHVYFGYDLLIEPSAQANTYKVTIRPLSLSPDKLRLDTSVAWRQISLPGYPAPKTVHGGDTIALDLLANGSTGQKVVDYILIQNRDRPIYTAGGTARDFSIDDAELRIQAPRITRNGAPLQSAEGGVSGAAVALYIPDYGRYCFSLLPHPELGFQKAGEIRGSTLTFTLGGDTYRVDVSGRIAPGYSAYNLYVYHDPAWQPREPGGRVFQMAGSDNPAGLVRSPR